MIHLLQEAFPWVTQIPGFLLVSFCLSDQLSHDVWMGPVLPGASYRPGGYLRPSEGLECEGVCVSYVLTHSLTH